MHVFNWCECSIGASVQQQRRARDYADYQHGVMNFGNTGKCRGRYRVAHRRAIAGYSRALRISLSTAVR